MYFNLLLNLFKSLNPVLGFLPRIAVGGNTVELRFMMDFKLVCIIVWMNGLSISKMISSPLFKLKKVDYHLFLLYHEKMYP